MPIVVTLQVKGLEELKRKLQSLPNDMRQKVMRRGVAAGAGIVRRAVVAAAPIAGQWHYRRVQGRPARVAPGTLRRSIIIKYDQKASDPTQVLYLVTARQGKKFQPKFQDAYYAGWVERGHKIVPRLPKGGKSARTLWRIRRAQATRRVEGRWFMRAGIAASRQRAVDRMVRTMELAITKLLKE